MKVDDLKDKQQERLSKIFDSLGIFFAFSQAQFDESKKEGVVYVNGGMGMIIPKSNIEEWKNKYKEHTEICRKEFLEHIPLDECIKYELYNYEAFYTYDTDEALAAVQHYYPNCTEKDIKRVFDLEKTNAGEW